MSYDAEDDDGTYAACAHCGKTVYAGVFECPYCFKDPSGEDVPCQKCGRALPTGAAECPYCKSYTGEIGEPIPRRRHSPVYIIGVILLLFAALVMFMLHSFR